MHRSGQAAGPDAEVNGGERPTFDFECYVISFARTPHRLAELQSGTLRRDLQFGLSKQSTEGRSIAVNASAMVSFAGARTTTPVLSPNDKSTSTTLGSTGSGPTVTAPQGYSHML